MDVAHQLVHIFVEVDDFCKQLENYNYDGRLLGDSQTKRPRGPRCGLSDSEIMTLLMAFQRGRFRDFKSFYFFITQHYACYFPGLPSYQRFVELIPRALFPLVLFTQCRKGKDTGIFYIDSTCLPVCSLPRSKRHKTFAHIAAYGKTSVGWFFGLKLHVVINDQGELIAFKLTKGNDHDARIAPNLLDGLQGLAFGDKGYLGKKIAEILFQKGLKLITRKRRNMQKKEALSPFEKQMLNQRGIIETVIGHLKQACHIWHTRHRSIQNAFTHLVAALAAYALDPLKISAMRYLATP